MRSHQAIKTEAVGWGRALVLGAALGVFACSTAVTAPTEDSRIGDVTAKIAQAAAAVTGQKASLADDYEKGRYVGFDTHTYPGSRIMKAWKDEPGAPYSWVGYYLPSPCHDDTSWTGKRDTLLRMGWGVAVVYVGQQTWGKTPRNRSAAQLDAIRKKSDCSTDLITASEGKANADDAVARASAEGFPQGAVVFLDLERMEKIPPAMREYYRAWVARMLEIGKYRPGIYMHQHNAEDIYADVKDVFRAAGNTEEPRFWIAGGKNFDEGRAPQDVGFAFAGVWQGVIDVARSVANVRLPVDVNVASWASPSESGTQTQ
jgi:hypothetical protein